MLISKACLYILYHAIKNIDINIAGFFVNLISRRKKDSYNTYVDGFISLFFEHFDVSIEPATTDFKILDLDLLKKNVSTIL